MHTNFNKPEILQRGSVILTELQTGDRKTCKYFEFHPKMAAHGVDGETEPIHKGGGKVSDAESGRAGDVTSVVAVSKETTHRVGEGKNINSSATPLLHPSTRISSVRTSVSDFGTEIQRVQIKKPLALKCIFRGRLKYSH